MEDINVELIKITSIGGIKCDNPKCDYKDDTVKVEDYPGYVNRPCPLCGWNLLNKKDFLALKIIISLCNVINRIAKNVPDKKNVEEPNYDVSMQVDFNGSGKPDMKICKRKKP